MEELRFVLSDLITIFSEKKAKKLFTAQSKGFVRNKIFLMNEKDEVVAVMKSNIFGIKWHVEDIDNNKTALIKRRMFGSKWTIKENSKQFHSEDSNNGKIRVVGSQTNEIAISIDPEFFKSKDTLLVEHSGYLSLISAVFFSLLLINQRKLI